MGTTLIFLSQCLERWVLLFLDRAWAPWSSRRPSKSSSTAPLLPPSTASGGRPTRSTARPTSLTPSLACKPSNKLLQQSKKKKKKKKNPPLKPPLKKKKKKKKKS